MKAIAKLFLVAALLVTISSCDRQNCQDVVCAVGEACNNGQCYCADGLEGTNCTTYSYEKYTVLSNYSYESCNSSTPFPQTTTAYITWDGSANNVLTIHNLMGGGCPGVTAFIRTDTNNEGNIIEINEQNCGGSTVYGQGTYDRVNHRLNLQLVYTVGGGQGSYNCNLMMQ